MAERCLGIIGATGFLGRKLAERAVRDGWKVCGFRRGSSPAPSQPAIREWREWTGRPGLSGLEAIVNLAGHPIDRRWTEKNRQLFYESRIGVTRTLAQAIQDMPPGSRPAVMVNGSAVGIYGDRGDAILAEDATPGDDYLGNLCREWEAAADPIADLGVRVAKIRTGIVLGNGGAAFEKMRRVFAFGLGGQLGSGSQWMPWIHVQDLVEGILHIAGHANLSGPVNGSAPHPVTNAEFTRELARALHRPALFRVPGFALKAALDGFGSAVLASQRAVPQALVQSGFQFNFPDLPGALHDLVKDS